MKRYRLPISNELIFAIAVLGAIEFGLLIQIIVPFVIHSNLQTWDMIGHFTSAEFTHSHLWPYIFGWNPRFFLGFPQSQLYPPLLAYASAALGHLISVSLALKLLVSLAVFATPLIFFYLARAVQTPRVSAALATLAMSCWWASVTQEIGGTVYSTFVVGNLTNAIGLPLSLAYLASLRRAVLRNRGVLLPTVLFGLTMITHLVAAMFCACVLICELCWTVMQHPETIKRQIVTTLVHVAGMVCFSAFYLLPFLLWFRYGSSDIHNFEQYPAGYIEMAAGYLVFLFVFVFPIRGKLLWAPIAITAATVFVIRTFILRGMLDFDFVLRPHRYKVYDTLLLVFLASMVAEHLVLRAIPKRFWGVSASALGLLGCLLFFHALSLIPAAGVSDQPMPRLPRLTGRVMVISSPRSQVSHHTVQHLVPLLSENQAIKGLFMEAAANAKVAIELERAIAHSDYPVRYWSFFGEDPRVFSEVRRNWLSIADRLGISFILTNEPLSPITARTLDPGKKLEDGFTLYKLPQPALVEVMKKWPRAIAPENYPRAVRRWFLDGGREEIATFDESAQQSDTAIKGEIRNLRTSANRDRIRFFVKAEHPVPVLIKVSYFPNFRAYDAAGNRLPLFRAAPYIMGTVAKGLVEIRYQARTVEKISAGLSMLFWLGIVLVSASRVLTRRGYRIPSAIRIGVILAAVLVAGFAARVGFVKPAGQATVVEKIDQSK
jgi:hypothetical protein